MVASDKKNNVPDSTSQLIVIVTLDKIRWKTYIRPDGANLSYILKA